MQVAEVPEFVGAQAGEITELGNAYLFRANISQVVGMGKNSPLYAGRDEGKASGSDLGQ